MPFVKTGNDTYKSPSGRKFNSAQVKLYYANGGHFPGEKTDDKLRKGRSAPKSGSGVRRPNARSR